MGDFFSKDGKFKSAGLGSDILTAHSGTTVNDKAEGFFQPVIIYNRHVKVLFHEEQVPFTFSSNVVFLSKEEAVGFLPYYIKKLVDNGDLPKDVLNEDRSINETLIRAALVKLNIGKLEKAE